MDDREALRGYLTERDIPCPGCGYNLRGLPGDTCPECRQELRLVVGLAETRIAALVAILGPLFAGVGASGGLLVVVMIVMVSRAGGSPRGMEVVLLIWMPLGCLVTCGAGAAVMCARRARVWFRKQHRGRRTGIVVASIALPVLWFVVFLGMLMSNM